MGLSGPAAQWGGPWGEGGQAGVSTPRFALWDTQASPLRLPFSRKVGF